MPCVKNPASVFFLKLIQLQETVKLIKINHIAHFSLSEVTAPNHQLIISSTFIYLFLVIVEIFSQFSFCVDIPRTND